MRDIVEHLRRQASKQDMLTCEDMLQAADEIERLRSVINKAPHHCRCPAYIDDKGCDCWKADALCGEK